MKHTLILLLSLVFSIHLKAEETPTVIVYTERMEDEMVIYGDNANFCPASVQLELKVTNLSMPDGNSQIYLLEANAKKQLLAKLKIIKKDKPFKIALGSLSTLGDHKQTIYDKDFNYSYPIKAKLVSLWNKVTTVNIPTKMKMP